MSPPLDPGRAYILSGGGSSEAGPTQRIPGGGAPKVLHVKLSALVLEEILASQESHTSVQIKALEGGEPVLLINEEQHALHSTTENTPHQLYSISSGSTSLKLIGNVSTKYAVRSDGQQTSSAASRLKERKELEDARKAEHRTILLDTAPTAAMKRSAPSTSKLKLRKKGLAPSSINSPLTQSRAGTPIEHLSSLPGSPSLGALDRTAKTMPTPSNLHNISTSDKSKSESMGVTSSPPTLRKRIIQLLAKGPMSRRNIVSQMNNPEPATLSLLYQVSLPAAEHLQPRTEAAKKFSGPVNRRNSTQPPASSATGDRGAGTIYVLKDDMYPLVLIKEWGDYDVKERQIVSELMEAALKRLKIRKEAEEWKRLYPDGRSVAHKSAAEKSDERLLRSNSEEEGLSPPTDTTKGGSKTRRYSDTSSSLDSPTKLDVQEERSVTRTAIKKNSTMDRLKKAAKGKGSSRSSTPVSSTPASTAKNSKAEKAAEEAAKAMSAEAGEGNSKQSNSSQTTRSRAAGSPTAAAVKEIKSAKAIASNASETKKKEVLPIRNATRKDIEYTDSSEEDDQKMEVDRNRPSRSTVASSQPAPRSASSISEQKSTSPEGKRIRHGVGSGAAFTSEPWLDVKSRKDWDKLAERFNRVFEDYTRELNGLQEEERMIRLDLQKAQEEKSAVVVPVQIVDTGLRLDIEVDEKEEGEASPTMQHPPLFGVSAKSKSMDPPSLSNVAWRTRGGDGKDRGRPAPMTYDAIKSRVARLQETEAQLSRMKGTLQTSKRMLEVGAA